MNTLNNIIYALFLTAFCFSCSSSADREQKSILCEDVIITVKDSAEISFITTKDVEKILQKSGLNPKNKKYNPTVTDKIEQELKKHQAVKTVDCYPVSSGNVVRIDLLQRKPVFRVLNGAKDYYVDMDGCAIRSTGNYIAYVPVVTGKVSQEFAQKELKDFIVNFQKDDFWEAQIVQIDVQNNDELILVPRLGKHVIEFGNMERAEAKFEKLKTFYRKVLEQTGWDKFRKISVKVKDEVVVS